MLDSELSADGYEQQPRCRNAEAYSVTVTFAFLL
jgi:hypothetical protein